MMEMYPYGANIIVTSIESNTSEKIPLGYPDFAMSKQGLSIIKYSYEEKNGTLIDISTNLKIINFDKNNKTFTLSNEEIVNTSTQPYIKLLCNNVKIPISFIDHDGTGNKWGNQEIGSNKIRLKGGGSSSWVDVAKEFEISWNSSAQQQIFIGKNVVSPAYGEYYACEAFYQYLDNNNKIQNGNDTIWSLQQAPNGYITIPKLNGESSSLKHGNTIISTKKFINYFTLGIQVKILDGYSVYQADTRFYVDGTNRIYDNTSFISTTTGKNYLQADEKIPNYYYDNLNYQWNTSFFYKFQSSNTYISPSTSQIKTDWAFGSSCDSYCSCDCNYSCPDCSCDCNYSCPDCSCDCNYGGGNQIVIPAAYQNPYTGQWGASATRRYSPSSQETVFVAAGSYSSYEQWGWIGFNYNGYFTTYP